MWGASRGDVEEDWAPVTEAGGEVGGGIIYGKRLVGRQRG